MNLSTKQSAVCSRILLFCGAMVLSILALAKRESNTPLFELKSPDKTVRMVLYTSDGGALQYELWYQGQPVMRRSNLGLTRSDGDFSSQMSVKKLQKAKMLSGSYHMLNGKRSTVQWKANEQVLELENLKGRPMAVVFRMFNDGLAFQYRFSDTSQSRVTITDELTAFHFFDSTRSWLQPKAEAQSGWEHTNPSYEEHYLMNLPVGQPSPSSNGWIFPALFQYGQTWMAITEAAVSSNYCGSALRQQAPDGHYRIGFPHPAETMKDGPLLPASTLPWASPWRIITVGSLAGVVQSSLGTTLAAPAANEDFSWAKPGKSSWSWAIEHDNSITYDKQKQFIDYAADMQWAYCLVDVDWDTRIGYDKIKALADYGKSKNVGLLLWYNSSGDWNTTKYHPKSKLLNRTDRRSEFARLQAMGIKGVKIDFFAGDGQGMMAYYQDILKDAADYRLLVNFHGSTLPRGWHRSYPHLMTMEAVRGFEMITFDQKDADAAPAHCAMLPFGRNLFDPMDFTPVSFDSLPKINRRTSVGFELALTVLFQSGIQHYAERPQGMLKVPEYVKAWMRQVPAHWDDLQFIDGFPGKYVVMARKAQRRWYVAGINATTEAREIVLPASLFGKGEKLLCITDGTDNGFRTMELSSSKKHPAIVTMMPNGGFVAAGQ